jgi:hypothetical protein
MFMIVFVFQYFFDEINQIKNLEKFQTTSFLIKPENY